MYNKVFILNIFLVSIVISGCKTLPVSGPVAFSRLTGDYWQIWTMQPDGSQAKQVTTSATDKHYPTWVRDGEELLFRTNNNRVFSVSLDTGQEKPVLASLGFNSGIASSPDGSKLLLVRFKTQPRESADLWLTTLEGEDLKVLTNDTHLQYDPAWSPDGKQIIYISGSGYQTFEIYSIDSDGNNKRQITDNKALELLPAFSPDGKTIAYVSDITEDYEIWLMNKDGTNPRRVTYNSGIDTRPCWSPDGSEIIFVSGRSGQLQIWIMNNDGSNPRQLTAEIVPCVEPSWRKKKQQNEK